MRTKEESMQREIEFRGWHHHPAVTGRAEFNGWVYGYYYQDFDGSHWIRNPDSRSYKVDSETVGQYIGRKNRDGKKIWEGDVVRKEKDEYIDEEETGLVVWSKGWPMFTVSQITGQFDGESFEHSEGINFSWEELEVIGNAHETPRLLNEN